MKDRKRILNIIKEIKDETIKDYLNCYLNILPQRGVLRPVYDNELVGFLIEYLRKEDKISEILFYDKNSNYRISIRYYYAGKYSRSSKDLLDALLTFLEENNI